jgi:hypothetical protein
MNARLAVCVAIMMGVLTLDAPAGQRVEVRISVPEGLGQYTGLQPFTFGVPFEKGALKTADGVRLLDEQGKPLPCQFEVTGTWGAGSKDVQWLLVDGLAEIRAGAPPRMYLEFGKDVAKAATGSSLKMEQAGAEVRISTGAVQFDAAAGTPGRFVLTDGDGKIYRPAKTEVTVEKTGPVRGVVKMTGRYEAEDGSSIARFVTRVRVYAGCSQVRIYHTMVWTEDDNTKIGGLKLVLPAADGAASAGLDGQGMALAKGARLFQKDWNVVAGAAAGKQLDGWAMTAGESKTFVALRWPWQQFPTSMAMADAGLEVGLIGPEAPLSLKPMDAAVEAVKRTGKPLENGGLDSWDINANVGLSATRPANGKIGAISPRGVARTWEILVDLKPDPAVSPAMQNLLVQHPVLACADPAFATRAGVPSPAAPIDPQKYPELESALRRAFGWVTRLDAADGDYGAWNWGDLQWHWMELGGYTGYRYWMNNGKGWPAVPWVLWLRSGDRAYFEHGEANGRHIMDVDTCHVDDWSKDGKPRDGKVTGGIFHYCALHWAYGPRILPFYSDSEYLPVYYRMTGYERARDVMMERVAAITETEAVPQLLARMQDPQNHSRHLYAPTKDMLVLYEATGDERLGKYARTMVSLIIKCQEANGHFFGVKTNHYLDQMLHLARRVLGDDDGAIAAAITRWVQYNGDGQRGGKSVNIENGWESLWSLVVAGEQTKDAHYLNLATRIVRTQASVVDDSATDWRGIAPIFLHEIGPALRDWPIVLAALDKLPADKIDAGFEGMTYICGSWKPAAADAAKGWTSREIALLLSEKGEAVTVKIHLWGGGVGPTPAHIRVRAPDKTILLDEERDVQFGGQYGDKSKQTMDEPVTLSIPAGKAGVYAVEFLMKSRQPFMHIRPDNGKVVYVLKPKAGSYLVSPVYAGQVWFEPVAGEPLVFGAPANQVMGRMVLLDPEGKVVASQQATGTRQVKSLDDGRRPDGGPIRVDADKLARGLHSVVMPTPRDKNCQTFISGCKPWFAARKSEWFDPAAVAAHPDLEDLMKE